MRLRTILISPNFLQVNYTKLIFRQSFLGLQKTDEFNFIYMYLPDKLEIIFCDANLPAVVPTKAN